MSVVTLALFIFIAGMLISGLFFLRQLKYNRSKMPAAIVFSLCLFGIFAVASLAIGKPVQQIEQAQINPFHGTVFDNDRPHDTLGTYRTFIQSGFLRPAIITVLGNKKQGQNVLVGLTGTSQWGYAIMLTPIGRISSRFQPSLESHVGPYEITAVYLSITDTTSNAWKNCKGTVQW